MKYSILLLLAVSTAANALTVWGTLAEQEIVRRPGHMPVKACYYAVPGGYVQHIASATAVCPRTKKFNI